MEGITAGILLFAIVSPRFRRHSAVPRNNLIEWDFHGSIN